MFRFVRKACLSLNLTDLVKYSSTEVQGVQWAVGRSVRSGLRGRGVRSGLKGWSVRGARGQWAVVMRGLNFLQG